MMEIIILNEQFRRVSYLIILHTLVLAKPREEEIIVIGFSRNIPSDATGSKR